MKVTYRHTVIANLTSVLETEIFIKEKMIINNFNCFPSNVINNVVQTLVETDTIGIKQFKQKWLSKFINCQSAWNQEYWIQRGHNPDYAKEEIFKLQSKNANKSAVFFKNLSLNDNEKYRTKRAQYKEFWLAKGFSEQEAIEKAKDRQATISLKKYKLKYGLNVLQM